MRIDKILRDKTGLFSELANKLVYGQNELKDFLGSPFSEEAFAEQLEIKKASFPKDNRAVIASVLNNNYSTSNSSGKQMKNLENLALENTFTVTTGHQLSLFTGPLYFIIKILHVVNLAERLTEKYPNSNFVPVFWMATEDHDFEEINQVNLFNQKRQWSTQQTGAVGRFKMENWEDFKSELRELFSNHPDSEVMNCINAYDGSNLAEATFNLVNAIFGEMGVLALDGDQKELKKLFAPIVKREIKYQLAHKAVQKTNSQLETAGFFAQARAREINIFLLDEQKRVRIEQNVNTFFIEGIGEFTSEELLAKLESQPEQFSPNVILRPVYQECILPNLCYVGGVGEMAYWLQLKGVFEAYEVPYPLIQVRNSMMIIDHATNGKLETIGWTKEQLFEDVDALKKQYVLENTEELDFTELREKKDGLVAAATSVVVKVDPNMKGFLEAEMTRLSKQMENLEQKLLRAEKNKFEKSLKQMDQIKDKLFPNGGLQERSSNFFNFCSDGKVQEHLLKMKESLDPFEKDFTVCYF